MQKRWNILKADVAKVDDLQRALKIDPKFEDAQKTKAALDTIAKRAQNDRR